MTDTTRPLTDEPRTEAGTKLARQSLSKPVTIDQILAIEAEAGTGLDVERLAKALETAEVGCIGFGGLHDGNDAEYHHRRDAGRIAREYAALSQPEPKP